MILKVDNCAAFAEIVIEGIEDDGYHRCTYMFLRCCNRDWGYRRGHRLCTYSSVAIIVIDIASETGGMNVPPRLKS